MLVLLFLSFSNILRMKREHLYKESCYILKGNNLLKNIERGRKA